MRAKERVLTTLARGAADRVPINYEANPGIDARLKAHFGLAPGDREGLLQALGVDFRGIWVPYTGLCLHAEVAGVNVDPMWGWHTRWVEHESGGYWDFCDFPLRDADAETVATWPVPAPDDYDYSGVADACRAQAEYAVFVGNPGFGDIINSTSFLFGMEQVLVDLITDNPATLAYIDRKLDAQLGHMERVLDAAEGGIDFLWMGEDLGSQISPLISLELYRQHISPRHQRIIDLAKAYDLPVMIHTCGASSWAYDDLIAMGLDAVDTLQPEATGMAPRELKARFGDRLAFHGCISTAGPVAYGTVADVIRDCRETLEIMMPGGGYCFSPTHALQDNSPTENVVAMYAVAHDAGRY